ncbi:uncharacterized protein LOC131936535 isoform X2 [Physella acuta]|uniref:uncharacterized protein LOC131936535 isoform X2 n=1 Tax=Physella acuta TaxID=109671 RepID=UPI0027DDFB77|nr:uncharacterized protein LOC131936535 isoform X2 [Physella acuta]
MTEIIPCLIRVGYCVQNNKLLKLHKDKAEEINREKTCKATYRLLSDVISTCYATMKQDEDNIWSITDNMGGIHVNGCLMTIDVPFKLQEGDMIQLQVFTSSIEQVQHLYKFHLIKSQTAKNQHKKLKTDPSCIEERITPCKSENLSAEDGKRKDARTKGTLRLYPVDVTTTSSPSPKECENQKALAEIKKLLKEKEEKQIEMEKELEHQRQEREVAELKLIDQQKDLLAIKEVKTREDVLSSLVSLMEVELNCSICNELFIAATSLNCSHVFCKFCISKWMKQKKECPNCRTIITTQIQILALDNYIDKMVDQLSEDRKTQRKTLIDQRKTEEFEYNIMVPGPSTAPEGIEPHLVTPETQTAEATLASQSLHLDLQGYTLVAGQFLSIRRNLDTIVNTLIGLSENNDARAVADDGYDDYRSQVEYDESEDDKSENDESEDDESEEDKSENDESEDDESEEDKSEDDESEEYGSEEDESEDDESEDDESEDD